MPDREKTIKDFEYQVREAHGEGWDFVDITTEDGFNILKLLKEQNERVKMLEHQLETITRWRANAGAFDQERSVK